MKTKLLAAVVLSCLLLQASAPFAYALTKQVDGFEVVDKRSYPIIFIHGAAGSELDGADGNYWPGTLWTNDNAFDRLALAPDGARPAPGAGVGVWPTKVMRYGAGWEMSYFPDLTFASVYNGFYNYLEKEGYHYNSPNPDGKVFYDFVYDWRQDNRKWTSALDQKVEAVRQATKADKVILMGHSMGGIQIRLYMKDPARAAKAGGVVFMGVPQHGAPQVIWSYTEGYNFGNKKVSNAKMWEIMKNWPAGYQLLPDWTAIRDKKTGRIWSTDEMYGDGFISDQEYQHYLKAKAAKQPYQITYGLPNAAFRRDVVPFHQALGDTAAKYNGKYWLIKGDGVNTLQLLDATLVDVSLPKPLLKLERIELKAGDGTVPAKGSDLKGVDSVILVPGAEHGDIPSNAVTQGHLTSIRKEINDEDFRTGLVKRATDYASSHLADLKTRHDAIMAEQGGEKKEMSLIEAIFRALFFGQKDEEKVKARDDLFDRLARLFANARANVVIAGDDKKDTDTLYLKIENFAVTGSGNGGFTKPTVTVKVASYDVFNKIMSGQLDGRQALKSGQVDLVGSGFVEMLKLKALQWINKYILK